MKNWKAYLAVLLVLCGGVLYAADLSVTAANVVPASGYQFVDGTAGETITAGQPLYLKASDTRYWKADSDASSATATVIGIALNGSSAGQPVRVQTGGDINIGATLTVGEIYVLSATAGAICPEGDLVTDDFVSILGVATTASNLKLRVFVSGVDVP
jgi:hypothetical protein